MKKHFTTAQIKWIIGICLIITAITHIPDIIQGLVDGYHLGGSLKR